MLAGGDMEQWPDEDASMSQTHDEDEEAFLDRLEYEMTHHPLVRRVENG